MMLYVFMYIESIYVRIYIYIQYGCFPKRYSKKKTDVTFECRWHVFSFSFSSGPRAKCSSTARQRKVCVRFAQGLDS